MYYTIFLISGHSAVDALNGDAKRVNLSPSGAAIKFDNPWLSKYKNCQPTSLELTAVALPPVTSSSASSFRVRRKGPEVNKQLPEVNKQMTGSCSPSRESSEAHIIVNEFFQSSPIEEKIESDV